jgi:transcription elongation factor GreB
MAERDESGAKRDEPIYMTPEGYARLKEELEHLGTVERPKVVQGVADAAAEGDRSENAEYIYGKKRLREIDRRMRFLRKILEATRVVDPKVDRGDKIFFGATVVLETEDGQEVTYQLVGEHETDPTSGRISFRSPLGASLMRKSEGDDVTFVTPNGTKHFAINRVLYR